MSDFYGSLGAPIALMDDRPKTPPPPYNLEDSDPHSTSILHNPELAVREYTDSANVHYVHYVMSCALMRHDMNMERLDMDMFICAITVRVMLVPEVA